MMANIVDVARWLEANPGLWTLPEVARGARCSIRSAGRSLTDLPFARPGLVERLQRGVYVTPARLVPEQSQPEPEAQPEPEPKAGQAELIMPDYDDAFDHYGPEPEPDPWTFRITVVDNFMSRDGHRMMYVARTDDGKKIMFFYRD